MSSGTVGYTDTRSSNNYLGSVAKAIGNRLKQASNMASEERAYASKRQRWRDIIRRSRNR